MAQYTITHTCGHEEIVQLYGKGSDRDSRRAWLAARPCQDCKRNERTAAASVQSANLGLVDLQGSDKQINWAKTLRQEFLDQFERVFAKAQGTPEEAERARNAFITVVNNHPDARFWIDHRGETVRLFAGEYEAAFKTTEDK